MTTRIEILTRTVSFEVTTLTLEQLFEWRASGDILIQDYSDIHVPLSMWQLTKLFGSASVA